MTANNVTQPVPSNRYHRTNSSKQNDDVLDGKTNDVDDTYEFSDLLPLSRKLVRYMQHDDISDKDGMNADFVQAVQDGDIEKVSTLLQTTVRDINTITTRGRQRISVLQLAAEQNNFHLVKLLLQYGASKIKLPSLHAKEDVSDTLTSLRQYGALTSPAYICLTSKDPFKTAFELSWKLKSLTSCSFLHDLTHTEYSEMDRNVQIFSKDLLEQCHSSREVIVLLGGNYVCNGLEWWKSCKLPLLEEALEKQQKLFVGSLHCQQVLKQAWVYGQPIFTQTNNWGWFLIYGIYDLLLYGLLQPILSFIFIFFPCCSIAKIISAPRSKFLMMAFSYVAFLVLSTLAAIMKAREETEEVNTVTSSYYLIVAVTIWVCGMLWYSFLDMVHMGPLKFFGKPWNIFDILVEIIIFTACFYHIYPDLNVAPIPSIFINKLPAFAIMLATLRLMENLLPSKYLGPMLLCFLAMRKDVIRFLCIFSIITFAFSAGLYYLYADPHNTTQNAYSSLLFSINSLLFTIFGRDASADLLATVMVPLYNESRAQQHIATLNMSGDDWTHRPTFDASQIYTAMGMVLYTTFGIGVLLVLLNICIAMMSDRYARFQESVDEEWKFVRTVMWVHCFSTPTLPSPFNLIPSPMYLYNLVQCMCGWRRACNKMKTNEVGIVLQDVPVSLPYQEDAWDLTYDELVRVLVHRYLQKKVPKTKNGSPRQTKDVDTSSATPHQQNELRLLNSTPV